MLSCYCPDAKEASPHRQDYHTGPHQAHPRASTDHIAVNYPSRDRSPVQSRFLLLAVLDGQFEIGLGRKCSDFGQVRVDVHFPQYAFLFLFILTQVEESFQEVGADIVQQYDHYSDQEAEKS